jgi:hypothetical protein
VETGAVGPLWRVMSNALKRSKPSQKGKMTKINLNPAYASLKRLGCFSCYVQIGSFNLEMFWKKNLDRKAAQLQSNFQAFFFFFPIKAHCLFYS